jgi:heme A synthase
VHRCAILLSGIVFLSLLSGTAVTTNEERPFYTLGQSHFWLGIVIAIVTVALVISIHVEKERLWLRHLGWILLAVVALQAGLGTQPLPQAPAVRMTHAFFAQLLFPATVAVAACTSARWKRMKNEVQGPASWRFLANCTTIVVLAQVALGTLFRHGALGVGPHLVGAFLVTFFILAVALPAIYRPEQAALRRAARCFLAIASMQLFFGLTLFSIQLMDVDPTVTIVLTMIHAATGDLLLAATMMMIRGAVGVIRVEGGSGIQ